MIPFVSTILVWEKELENRRQVEEVRMLEDRTLESQGRSLPGWVHQIISRPQKTTCTDQQCLSNWAVDTCN